MSTILEQYRAVAARVAAVAEESGRAPSDVELLAVSKTFPASAIRELYEVGVRRFGENRVAELSEKAAVLPDDIQWHLIGQLQSNKVRKAVQLAAVIHSVDSRPLLERIDRIAGEENRCPVVLLEVNVSGEASKSGCTPAELIPLADVAVRCGNLKFQGLMTMAPAGASEEELERVFRGLAGFRTLLEEKIGLPLPLLSMGMSGDFETAIRCGSTLVRIGSAIFGRRG